MDNRVENGSSIAFILSFKEKNYLFLGDAHPKVVLDSLNTLGYNKDSPIKVEFLKISHHGSCKNTTKELLESIETDNYIVSTDSSIHNHPDKRTLARIISNNTNATLYFNYDNVKQNIFSVKDYEDFKDIKAKLTTEYIIEE